MTSTEAKRILIALRPGRANPEDEGVRAALELARRDLELAEWWRQQQEFHAAAAKNFAEIPVPPELRAAIRDRAKIISLPMWRPPRVWAAVAAVVLFVGISVLLWKPHGGGNSFSTFRTRMVGAVLRQYRMDIQTNDMASIRRFLAAKSAPADYALPPGLAQLPPLGAGVLSWQAGRVSMVCLDGGAPGTMFLFVAEGSEVAAPPDGAREFAQVNKIVTISWTNSGKVYMLAAHGSRATLEKYF